MSTDTLSEMTEQVMAERRAKDKRRQPYICHGPCGKLLRPWRRTLGEFPGTTIEYSEQRCRGCWHQFMRDQGDPAFAIVPCTSCGIPTRPEREPEWSAPGTQRRLDGGRCSPCSAGPEKTKGSTEQIAAGLDSFLARMRTNAAAVRRRRGR